MAWHTCRGRLHPQPRVEPGGEAQSPQGLSTDLPGPPVHTIPGHFHPFQLHPPVTTARSLLAQAGLVGDWSGGLVGAGRGGGASLP